MKPPIHSFLLPMLELRDGDDAMIVAPVKIAGEYHFMVTIMAGFPNAEATIYLDKRQLDRIAGYAANICNPTKDHQ